MPCGTNVTEVALWLYAFMNELPCEFLHTSAMIYLSVLLGKPTIVVPSQHRIPSC